MVSATKAGGSPAPTYRHLRAGAESGWDFGARYLADPKVLASVRRTDIVPVDLNSPVLAMEEPIAARCRAANDLPAQKNIRRALRGGRRRSIVISGRHVNGATPIGIVLPSGRLW